MTLRSIVERLLEDVQEEYDFDHVLPLYMFAWSLAGLMSRDDPEFQSVCREAFEVFRAKHPGLVLIWVPWPLDLAAAAEAEPDTTIDLDLDPDGPTGAPLLALVPAAKLTTSQAESEPG